VDAFGAVLLLVISVVGCSTVVYSIPYLRKETEKDQPDEKTLDAVIDRISANHKQMLLMRVHNMMKIDAVLTRDQRKQLREKFIRGEKQMMKNGPPVGMPGEGGQF